MPEMIISQKAASCCLSKETVAICLRNKYPRLWKSRTLERKIFYGCGGKNISIAGKHAKVYDDNSHQTVTWPVFLRQCLHFLEEFLASCMFMWFRWEAAEQGA